MKLLQKEGLLLVCAVFWAVSVVACSQEESSPTASQGETGENAEPQGETGENTEPREPGDKPEECADKEVVYHHDTVTVYRDTVERVIEEEYSYTSFVYRDSAGAIDTVTEHSDELECEVGESEFSCAYDLMLLPVDGPFVRDPMIIQLPNAIPLIDTMHCHVFITDTVVKDTFYEESYRFKQDTTFINYGESRVTDYIPPDHVYELGEYPFDSTAIRDFFDTLDVGDSLLDSKMRLTVNSDLSFYGLPMLVLEEMSGGVVSSKILLERSWPEKWSPSIHTYHFEKTTKPESDTTITWTLEYTHYEKGLEEKDSIQVTSFFKTARASLGD